MTHKVKHFLDFECIPELFSFCSKVSKTKIKNKVNRHPVQKNFPLSPVDQNESGFLRYYTVGVSQKLVPEPTIVYSFCAGPFMGNKLSWEHNCSAELLFMG